MKKHFNFLLYLGLLFFYSCSPNSENKSITTKAISFEPAPHSEVFLEDTESFNYLPLGSMSDFFISHIDRLFFKDSLIIVADFRQKTIFVFNQAGMPKYKINHYGNGPGEYPQMTDVLFDEESGQVEVFSPQVEKIFSYTLDGIFVNEKRIQDSKYSGLRFAKLKDFYVFDRVSYPRDNRRIGVYDNEMNMKFIKSYLNIPPAIMGMGYGGGGIFSENNDSLYYLPVMSDTIYSVTRNGAEPVYSLNVPKANQVPPTLLEGERFEDLSEYSVQIDDNWVNNASWLLVSDKYVYFLYLCSNMPVSLFYSKNTTKVKQFTKLRSRANPDLQLLNVIRAKAGDQFVTTIHPTQYKNLPEDIKSTLSENSNPVLLFFKLKDF